MVNTIRTSGHEALIRALIEARHASGLSQRDLAQRIGSRPSGVANIELGQRRIDVIELIVLARALELDPIGMMRLVVERVDEDDLKGNFRRPG